MNHHNYPIGTYAEALLMGRKNTIYPYKWWFILCSVEYLHFGGRKAAGAGGSYAGGKKRLKGIKFFYH
ncbi:MAG: hypothetical protein F6K39_26815 [Okeania sp. SIO3B3]|nr:hypothetical protein [Okeania sp. SIO3B3]